MPNTIPYSEKLPDVVNCSPDKRPFTQIPNEILRNPDLSCKAKGILCLLLSNKEGWKTCINTLCKMNADGLASIQSGIQELEQSRYVKRIRYRDKKTKQYIGSFWGITDTTGKFKIHATVKWIKEQGWEIVFPKSTENPQNGTPHIGNPHMGKGHIGFPHLKRTNIKRTNFKDTNSKNMFSPSTAKITNSQFNLFWEIYPKKVAKGSAMTAWEKLCNKKDRPSLEEILNAVEAQKKSEQWQDPDYIKHPSGWLNNKHWLNDIEGMKVRKDNKGNGKSKFAYDEGSVSNPNHKTIYPKGIVIDNTK